MRRTSRSPKVGSTHGRSEMRIGKRGNVVIPAHLRRLCGMCEGDLVLAEEHSDGVLLRRAAVVPVPRGVDPEALEDRYDLAKLAQLKADPRNGKLIPWDEVRRRLKL